MTGTNAHTPFQATSDMSALTRARQTVHDIVVPQPTISSVNQPVRTGFAGPSPDARRRRLRGGRVI